MGSPGAGKVSPGQCVYVPTGAVLPEGADAVAMIEYAEQVGDEVLVRRPVAYGENVLFRDEDFTKGAAVLAKGRRLSPQDVGVLAAAGCTSVPVVQVPVIGIISTGNELVPAGEVPAPGQIRDANSHLCAAFVRERGCRPRHYGIVRDERDAFRSVMERAVAECDAVLISGGSSKDDRDMAAAVIGELGEVLVHGIAIAPGKPTIIGRSCGKPVIGLPGHPASAFIVLLVVVSHLLAVLCGEAGVKFRRHTAVLAANVPSSKGREDYVRVRLDGDRAVPVFGKSGLLNTLVQSDGVIRVPAGAEGFEEGTTVEVILW
jgi:molybdopterin molybdotransferase